MSEVMPVEAYRSASGLNYSAMSWLLDSPFHFKWNLGKSIEPSLAMRVGSAVDEWVLSGIVRPHAIMPPEIAELTGKGSGLAKTAWKAEQKAAGRTVYKREEWEKQSAMQRALEQNPDVVKLLQICPNRQTPLFFEYEGIPAKCLLDMDGKDATGFPCCGDLKCVLDASPRGFGKSAFNNNLDLQIVFYGHALAAHHKMTERPALFWVCVESSGTPATAIYRVPGEALESGQRKLDRCVRLYKECTAAGHWPSFGNGWLTPEWPRYADEATRWTGVQLNEEETN